MKKLISIIGIVMAIIAVLAMSVPAMATTPDPNTVNTSVTIGGGGNEKPVIKVKWEQEPDNNIYAADGVTNLNTGNCNLLESGDTIHAVHPDANKSQFNPPVIKGAKKLIQYYAVVQKVGNGSIGAVFAYVFHPAGSPAPYNDGSYNGLPPDPQGRMGSMPTYSSTRCHTR